MNRSGIVSLHFDRCWRKLTKRQWFFESTAMQRLRLLGLTMYRAGVDIQMSGLMLLSRTRLMCMCGAADVAKGTVKFGMGLVLAVLWFGVRRMCRALTGGLMR